MAGWRWHMAATLLLLLGLALPALSMPTTPAPRTATRNLVRHLPQQRQDAGDIDDFSWIKSYAAVGDSYAAGIGAGSRLTGPNDADCSRTDQSYPSVLNEDERLGDSSERTFSFLACSGAVIAGVIEQIGQMPANQDLITVSAGGNDLGLLSILNACIFRWWPFSDCDAKLKEAADILASDSFTQSLYQVLAAAKSKLSSNGRIYWTGYANFFGVDDRQCDGQSWSFWPVIFQQYLTLERRQRMNNLVHGANEKISDAVKWAGDQVTFVDYGMYYDDLKSRFCESGFPEPDPNRVGLLFYNWNTDDNAEPDNVFPRDESDQDPRMLMDGTFEAQINDMVGAYLKNNSMAQTNVTRLLPDPLNSTTTLNLTQRNVDKIASSNSMTPLHREGNPRSVNSVQARAGFQVSILGDSYYRLFHPHVSGHALISNLILYKMTAHQASKLSLPVPDEVDTAGDTCPLPQTQPEPACSANSVSHALGSFAMQDGSQTPNQLLYRLREVVCSNRCERPTDLPDSVAFATGTKTAGDCEISVPIQGGVEAYMYRGTESVDVQWQECWDSTQLIIEKCVQDAPNKGWTNGPNPYQYYEAGFRPINGEGSIHQPFGSWQGALRSSLSIASVGPAQKNDINCGNDPAANVRFDDCFDLIFGNGPGGFPISSDNTTEGICTDSEFCVERGNTFSPDGTVQYSHYCEIRATPYCAVVVSTKESSFGGYPGRSCVSPAQVNQFIRSAANLCAANGEEGWAAQLKAGDELFGWRYTVLGLVNKNNPGSVYSP